MATDQELEEIVMNSLSDYVEGLIVSHMKKEMEKGYEVLKAEYLNGTSESMDVFDLIAKDLDNG